MIHIILLLFTQLIGTWFYLFIGIVLDKKVEIFADFTHVSHPKSIENFPFYYPLLTLSTIDLYLLFVEIEHM